MAIQSHSSKYNINDYFELPNRGLTNYLNRTKIGNREIYRTPFAKGTEPLTVLESWMRILRPHLRDWPSLLQFEIDLAGKVGPMSVQKPMSERMDDVESYYAFVDSGKCDVDTRALEATVNDWKRVGKVRPANLDKTVANMRLSTNSGNPFFTKRKAAVKLTLPCTTTQVGEDKFQNLRGNLWPMAAVIGWRGQEGGPNPEDVKQRVVWMFPFAVNVMEQQVYQTLIRKAQINNVNPAWISNEAVDERITLLFDTKDTSDFIICTDFTAFDQHFNATCQKAARNIMRELLDNSEAAQWWIENVFDIKYNIPLIVSEDVMFTGPHGMGSGSGGTNFDETLVHKALQHEAAILAGETLNPNSMCLGDDGILTFPGITVNKVTETYTSHGLEMNETKQYASQDDVVYLRRWHHTKFRRNGICVGVYSTCRALGKLMFQERFYDPSIWNAQMVALRQLSILENCKYHPEFERFIRFCMKRDKYRLGIDIPGFLEGLDHLVEEHVDVIRDVLGYVQTEYTTDPSYGISNWEVVKLLRKIRDE